MKVLSQKIFGNGSRLSTDGRGEYEYTLRSRRHDLSDAQIGFFIRAFIYYIFIERLFILFFYFNISERGNNPLIIYSVNPKKLLYKTVSKRRKTLIKKGKNVFL